MTKPAMASTCSTSGKPVRAAGKWRAAKSRATAPASWAASLDSYETDLRARGGDVANARRVRHHLSPTLAAKPVALLTAAELRRWRDDLINSGAAPATVVRILKSAKASLNLATNLDPRIRDRSPWQVGLSGLPDADAPIDKVLSDADVLRLVAASYALDPPFGLVVDVLASTGTRTSQACRLLVADLQADRADPRLMMPSLAQGRRPPHIVRKPVPIPQRRWRARCNERPAIAAATRRCCSAPMATRGTRAGKSCGSSLPPWRDAAAWPALPTRCGIPRSCVRCWPERRCASSPRCTTPARR